MVLAPVLVLTAVASVLAVGAATRAQIDTRLAAHAVAAARADLAATGLLDALLDDLHARLRAGGRVSEAGIICAEVTSCADDYPRLAVALGRVPSGMAAELALRERSEGSPIYLREEHAFGQRSHRLRLLEARVAIHGDAEAALAATVAVVEPRATLQRERR